MLARLAIFGGWDWTIIQLMRFVFFAVNKANYRIGFISSSIPRLSASASPSPLYRLYY